MRIASLTGSLARLLAITLAGFVACLSAQAAQSAEQRLCINEGATTTVATYVLEGRYRPLADAIQKATGRKVAVSAFTKVSLFEDDFNGGQCDYAFGKTIDVLSAGIKAAKSQPGKGYHAVVKSSESYVAGFIAHKRFPGPGLSGLVGVDVLLPPKDTFTAQLALAEIRNAGLPITERDTLDKFPTDLKGVVTVRYIAYQEAVASTVDSGWYMVGAVNPTVLKGWEKNSGRVLLKFKPQPGWAVLAASAISEKDRSSVAAALKDLGSSAEGKEVLKSLKIPAFVAASDAEYLDVLDYVRSPGTVTATTGASQVVLAKSAQSK